MHPLRASDFAGFFQAVYGYPPFQWQMDVARMLCDGGEYPSVFDLPTASGKTACLDIAVFHLAHELSNNRRANAPLRIIWAVDRRIVVDEAYLRAFELARKLEDAPPDAGPLRRVADALRSIAGRGEQPLAVHRLRGGMPREGDWARTPTQPTIIASTVDQIGSRLLFRGYGVSARMRSIHAGLLGQDALLFLDEVHLSEPFRQTLEAVSSFRREGDGTLPWSFVQLSATAGKSGGSVLRLPHIQNIADEKLRSRMAARKPATLVHRSRIEPNTQEHAAIFAAEALERMQQFSGKAAALIVVNRVALAGAIFDQVQRQAEEKRVDVTAVKLIGPSRPEERRTLVERILQQCKSNVEGERLREKHFVVVATQCIEAGADLDFDILVTQIAALDALRQRFGRLNRMGRPIQAQAAIVALDAEVRVSAQPDPIYDKALRNTWICFKEIAGGSAVDFVDFGVAALAETMSGLSEEDIGAMLSPRPNAPILMRDHLMALTRTSQAPAWSPDPSLFLHGVRTSPADVNVVWRADLPDLAQVGDERQATNMVDDIISLLPPRIAEAIQIPIGAVSAWLRGKPISSVSDVEARADETEAVGGYADRLGVWRLGRSGQVSLVTRTNRVRPGDTILVPASYGGCDDFGWNPATSTTDRIESVRDIAEDAALPYASRSFAVRIHPELLKQQQGEESLWPMICDALAAHEDVGSLLTGLLGIEALPSTIESHLRLLEGAPQIRVELPYGDEAAEGFVLFAPRGVASQKRARWSAHRYNESATESDAVAAEGPAADGQTLVQHSNDVRDNAKGYAQRLRLCDEIAEDVALAGYLHDVGKADARFQAYLVGTPWSLDPRVLAKSGARRSRTEDRAARLASRLPRGWRHEALSVRIARQHEGFRRAHDPELVLWLIGTHHGYGRPFFPHEEPRDEQLQSFRGFEPHVDAPLDVPASRGPQRIDYIFDGTCDGITTDWQTMFSRLQARYGIWQLALLESIVRLADHRASESSNKKPTKAATEEAAL